MLTSVRSTLRQRALEAALDVLRREGWPGVTMRAIGDAAGVSAAAIYRHFENKDELWNELIREVAAVFRDYLFEGMDAPEARRKASGCAPRRATVRRRGTGYYELLMETPQRSPATELSRALPTGSSAHVSPARGQRGGLHERGQPRRGRPRRGRAHHGPHAHGLIRMYRLGRFGEDDVAFARFYRESFGRILRGLGGPGRPRRHPPSSASRSKRSNDFFVPSVNGC